MYKTRIPVDKGTVLLGYGEPKPVPVPEHTRDHIVTVLPVPVSRLRYILTLAPDWRRYKAAPWAGSSMQNTPFFMFKSALPLSLNQ